MVLNRGRRHSAANRGKDEVITHLGGITRDDDLLLCLDLQHASRWSHDRVCGADWMLFSSWRQSDLEELACLQC